MKISEIRKIGFIGNYLPRKCGIATFTHDMHASISALYPDADCFVVPMNDRPEGYDYPPEVRFAIAAEDLESYRCAADFLNASNTDIVSLQHEYGIFGGASGGYILSLMRELQMPVVTTLHTVLQEPSPDQHRVLKEVSRLSTRVVVMTNRAKRFLNEIYGVPASKIDIIAHGIPDVPYENPNIYKPRFHLSGQLVALTFGLLSPNKGIEFMLKAMPGIIRRIPNFVYIVLGATHPALVQEEGERYRLSLEKLAGELGVSNHVLFYNQFVDLKELTEFIRASDIYVTPYLNPAQITSGTLAYSFGCGKPIVSTPYWHAEELLAHGRGVLVPFADSDALTDEIISLCVDEKRRLAMTRQAYMLGREMIWENSAKQYKKIFQRLQREHVAQSTGLTAERTLVDSHAELPAWRFDHLRRMTDNTGLIQHANHSTPNMAEGYCTDDNARALILAVNLEEMGHMSPELERMAIRYASFLHAAYNPATNRFRNFMGQDRQWLEEAGSEDSQGRTAWAFGACVGKSRHPKLSAWAAVNFTRAVAPLKHATSPRAWAFGLLGLNDYLMRVGDDHDAIAIRDHLTARLIDLYERAATQAWPWFEEILTYDLGRMPHALIATGLYAENQQALDIGLQSLRWLVKVQKAPRQYFRPVGCNGFYQKGAERARFDQQPIEANSMVSACLEAYRATLDQFWLKEARLAFEWFLGHNDLGQELYDPTSGGCFDGLQEDRINRNQGAESMLAFLLSLAEMNKLAGSRAVGTRSLQGYVPVSSV